MLLATLCTAIVSFCGCSGNNDNSSPQTSSQEKSVIFSFISDTDKNDSNSEEKTSESSTESFAPINIENNFSTSFGANPNSKSTIAYDNEYVYFFAPPEIDNSKRVYENLYRMKKGDNKREIMIDFNQESNGEYFTKIGIYIVCDEKYIYFLNIDDIIVRVDKKTFQAENLIHGNQFSKIRKV